jgi:hypothetical protein
VVSGFLRGAFVIYPEGSAGGRGIELPPEIIEAPFPENIK